MSDGLCFEDLVVGQAASFGKTITEADIVRVTGDGNPMQPNTEYARRGRRGERIARDMLAAGLTTGSGPAP